MIDPNTNINLHSRTIMTSIKTMAVVGSKIKLHLHKRLIVTGIKCTTLEIGPNTVLHLHSRLIVL